MAVDKVNKIMIKNTTTGQYDTADIGASAENITFDPTGSNLESTDAESAIKEVYGAIPANTSQLINDSNFVVSSSLANVATSGSYSDLSNTPSLANVATSGSYSDLSNTPVLATVATSGSYNDLSNKPTIPSIEANPSDTATNTLTKLEVDGIVYNVTSGSGGSTVAWNQIQTSTGATKIAEISIDGNSTDVYAPNQGSGGGIDYSTNEQSTGLTWIDGKTVYQKTFVNTNLQHDYEHDGSYNLGTMPTFETLVGYEGFACESTGVGWVGLNGINDINGWSFGFHITDNLVLLYPAGGTPSQMSVIEGGKAWVTVKYTKPTT